MMTLQDTNRLWLILFVTTCVCTGFPAVSPADGSLIASLFVWHDVLFMSVLASVPLSVLWTRIGEHSRSLRLRGFLATGVSTLAVMSILGFRSWNGTSFAIGAILRAVMSFLVTSALAAVCSVALSRSERRRMPPGYVVVAVMVWLVVPMVYVRARLQTDARSVLELAEQSRLAEACDLARLCQRLDPGYALPNGTSLARMIAQWDRSVRDLESRVTMPLDEAAPVPMRLERARMWLMLGNVGRAREILDAVGDDQPQACLLRALIAENLDCWEDACRWYVRSTSLVESEQSSSELSAILLQASRGIGYCERKRGRYRDAEAAYLRLLALAPTADNHFLLAQFYEDAQQSRQAANHARCAMALASSRYAQPGRQLLSNLATRHFGCLELQP